MLKRIVIVSMLALTLVTRGDEPKKEPAKPESIDFQKIKEIIPEKLGDLVRKECDGEKNKIGEMSISQVNAQFSGGDQDDSPSASLTIIDYSAPEIALAAAAWATVSVDKTTEGGYEKTVKVAGNPALEKFENEGKHGELIMFVAKRYIVTLHTSNMPAEQIQRLAAALPLDKLAALK